MTRENTTHGSSAVGDIPSKPKSRRISFAHNLFFSCSIDLQFCTEHGGGTAVLCAKFQNDWANQMGVMDGWDFARLGFKIRLGGISCIATVPGLGTSCRVRFSKSKSPKCIINPNLGSYCSPMKSVNTLQIRLKVCTGSHTVLPRGKFQ